MCFKSKSSASAPAVQAPTPVAPAVAAPKPPAAIPPVTERTAEVDAAGRQARVDAKKRKGMRATLLAGETGGYTAPALGEESKKTLLG